MKNIHSAHDSEWRVQCKDRSIYNQGAFFYVYGRICIEDIWGSLPSHVLNEWKLEDLDETPITSLDKYKFTDEYRGVA